MTQKFMYLCLSRKFLVQLLQFSCFYRLVLSISCHQKLLLVQAISIKEAQLVRNVALDLEIDGDNAEGPVRIVSPTRDDEKTLDDDYNITYQSSDGDDKKLGPATNKEGNVLSFKEEVHAVSENISNGNEGTMFNNFKGLSTYIDFLDELDQQLYIIEKDLMTVFERPAAILENEEKLNSSKVKQLEILENIRGARMRYMFIIWAMIILGIMH